MGTAFTVDGVFADREHGDALVTVRRACQELHRLDETFSTWRLDSPVSRFRQGALPVDELPGDVVEVLRACEGARTASGGWFDPWAAQGGVDPTGYVKGWAGQRLLDALRSLGAVSALVNAAGDVTGFGGPEPGRPWRLGLTDPFAKDHILGVVPVADSALAVSGTYERGEHVYDPRGGPAGAGVVSSAVVGPALGLADAFATALVAGGDEAFRQLDGLVDHEFLLIFSDGRRRQTDDFPLNATV